MRAYLTLDMLAALAIVAVLISISVPNLSNMMSELSLRKEAQKINYSLERMVTKASRDSVQYTLTLDKTGLFIETNVKPSTLAAVRELPKRYHLEFQPTNKQIHFYKQGTCSPASFQISNGDKKCIFTISLRCRISVGCAS
jgi:hypothetical protein